ncbi:hypothetical protein FRC00_003578 [Tulasnella sp. 408]|nr:hypothetical protein FRC00_003578 [Tulasnella sp. 408]
MPPDAHLTPWSLGDLSFTVDIVPEKASNEEPQETVIVLAQRDKRYFRELAGPYLWSMDFVLYQRGERLPMTRSVHSTLWDRSVKLEVKLAPGRYIIHARLDCKLKDPPRDLPDWRKRNRKQMALAASAIIATNCHDHSLLSQHLTLPPSELAGSDLGEIEIRAQTDAIRSRNATEKLLAVTVDTTNPPQRPIPHATDLLTPATDVGSSFAGLSQYQLQQSTIAKADSDTQEVENTYHQEGDRVESPTPFEHSPIVPSSPRPKKESRSSTHYHTPYTTFSSGGDNLGEGPSRGSRPTSRKGASTPKPGGCVSNSKSRDPLEKAEPLVQSSQVAQASSDVLMSSRHT